MKVALIVAVLASSIAGCIGQPVTVGDGTDDICAVLVDQEIACGITTAAATAKEHADCVAAFCGSRGTCAKTLLHPESVKPCADALATESCSQALDPDQLPDICTRVLSAKGDIQ